MAGHFTDLLETPEEYLSDEDRKFIRVCREIMARRSEECMREPDCEKIVERCLRQIERERLEEGGNDDVRYL